MAKSLDDYFRSPSNQEVLDEMDKRYYTKDWKPFNKVRSNKSKREH